MSRIRHCNCSGGSSLLHVAKSFNEEISTLPKNNINRVKYVYVLFRADNEVDADKKFKNVEMELIRYFDLTEKIKKMLFELNTILKEYNNDALHKEVDNKVNKILTAIINDKLLKEG